MRPTRLPWLPLVVALAATTALFWPGPAPGTAAPAGGGGGGVVPATLFGLQSVPKFDEAAGHGSWGGSRDRGVAMDRDLGVELSREGLIWRLYEPQPGAHPHQDDFDDAVTRLSDAGIAIEEMVTGTPDWAAGGATGDAAQFAVPAGLYRPVFADGTDVPAPGKAANPANPFARFLTEAAGRYRGRVRYWQVWNEPDFPSGDLSASQAPGRSWWGSVDDYVRLLQVASLAIRSRDPSAQVVTGGLGYAGYLDAILARGGGRYFDAVDFHAYGDPGSDRGLEAFLKVEEAMRRTLDRHGMGAKALLCSETGYTSEQPAEQAAYALKLYPTAAAQGVRSVSWYNATDPSWKQMGLVDWRTMTQRRAGYWAYREAHRALAGARSTGKLGLPPEAVGYGFQRPDGHQVAIAWAPYRDARHALRVTWRRPGTWQVFDLVHRKRGNVTAGQALRLTSDPIVLDTDLSRPYAFGRPNPPLPRPGLPIVAVHADSTDGGGFHEPGLAIDLDPDSSWLNGGFKAPEAWLSVELAHRSPLAEVRVKTGPTPPGTAFDLEVADAPDGPWRVARPGCRVADWGMARLSLPAGSEGRFVRLHFHNRPEDPVPHFEVFEVEVYPRGGQAPPTSPPQ